MRPLKLSQSSTIGTAGWYASVARRPCRTTTRMPEPCQTSDPQGMRGPTREFPCSSFGPIPLQLGARLLWKEGLQGAGGTRKRQALRSWWLVITNFVRREGWCETGPRNDPTKCLCRASPHRAADAILVFPFSVPHDLNVQRARNLPRRPGRRFPRRKPTLLAWRGVG
jgi:hypothetical protein